MKKRMKKRLIPLLIASLSLNVLTLTGCRNTAESSAIALSEAESVLHESVPSAEAVPEDEVSTVETEDSIMPKADASAEELEYDENTALPGVKYPVSDGSVTMTCFFNMFDNLAALMDSYADMPVMQEAEANMGLHIEWHSPGMNAASEQLNLMVAGGDLTDLIIGMDNYYLGGPSQAYEDEVIIAINEYCDEYLADYWNVVTARGQTKAAYDDNGNIYGIVGIAKTTVQMEGYLIRADWLEEAGLDVPETLEAWDVALHAFKSNHPDATDVLLMNSNCSNYTNLWNVSDYRVSNESRQDATSYLYQSDGEMHITMLEDHYRDYIAKLAEWYDLGFISSDFLSRSENANDSAYTECITTGNTGIFRTNGVTFLMPSIPSDIHLTGLPFPDDPYGEANHFFTTDNSTDSLVPTCCVSTSCATPELATAWMNYWYTDTGYMEANYGIEGVTYELVNGEPEYTEFFRTDPTKDTYVMTYFPHYTDNYTMMTASADNVAIEIMNLWEASLSDAVSWDVPGISLTTEESTVVNTYNSDVLTLSAEYIVRFITGEYDMDSQWDDFKQLLIDTGAEEIRGTYQSALDRYNSR